MTNSPDRRHRASRLSHAQCTHQGQAFSMLCALSLDSMHLFSAAAAANDTDLDTLVLYL